MPANPRISRFNASTLTNEQLFQLATRYSDHLFQDQYRLWNMFIFTVMFRHIGGNSENRKFTMQKEVHRVYEVLGSRLVRDSQSERGYECLPRILLFADCSNVAEINNSLHYQGLAIFHPINRSGEPISVLVEKHQKLLCGDHGIVERVHVQQVTHSQFNVRCYTAKSVLRRKTLLDDAVVLPKPRDEYRKRGSTKKPITRKPQRLQLPQNISWYAEDARSYRPNGKRRTF